MQFSQLLLNSCDSSYRNYIFEKPNSGNKTNKRVIFLIFCNNVKPCGKGSSDPTIVRTHRDYILNVILHFVCSVEMEFQMEKISLRFAKFEYKYFIPTPWQPDLICMYIRLPKWIPLLLFHYYKFIS